jgi:hypothetical protein
MGLNFEKQTNNLINLFVSKENDKIRLFIVISFAFLSGFKSFFLGLNDVTSLGSNLYWQQDPFHFGEAFAASMGYVLSPQTSQYSQYTIHGAWDILPTLISLATFGKNHFIFPTRVIINLCNLLSCFILITISWKLISPNSGKKLEKFIFILIIAFYSPQFVGIRDLFLLVSIFLFLECLKSQKSIYRFMLEGLLGLSLAFGMFWSFDRGIVGIVSLGVSILYCLPRDQRFVLTAFCGVLSVVILQFNDLFSIKLYLENFKFLSSTSYMWSYGFNKTIGFSIIATSFNMSALVYLVVYSNLLVSNSNRPIASNKVDQIVLIVSISTLSLLMLRIGINRADFGHIAFSLWVPYLIFGVLSQYSIVDVYRKFSTLSFSFGLFTLVLLFVYSQNPMPLLMCIALSGQVKIIPNIVSARTFYQLFILVTASIITLQAFLIPILNVNSYVRSFDSIFKLASAQSPLNDSLVDHNLLYAAKKLSLSKDECIFDLSNHGIFNAVLFLPPCTRFSYPVYADRSYEKIMISDLQKSNPSSIIYSSDNWSYKIDKKSMVERLPDLNTWILHEYPIEECVPSYCIRRKKIE